MRPGSIGNSSGPRTTSNACRDGGWERTSKLLESPTSTSILIPLASRDRTNRRQRARPGRVQKPAPDLMRRIRPRRRMLATRRRLTLHQVRWDAGRLLLQTTERTQNLTPSTGTALQSKLPEALIVGASKRDTADMPWDAASGQT